MATQQIDGGRQILAASVTNAEIAAAAAIASSKLASWSADRNANSNKLTNLAAPTAAGDATTKAYVDALAAGVDWKASARLASTANVAGTYSATGGTSARGQFTAMPNSIDGISLAANDRILLKDQTTGAQNGIWSVTTVGTGADGVWDRATDFDADAEVTSAATIPIAEGTTNADTVWLLTTNDPIVIGGASGTALVFTQWYTSATAGAGMTQSGSTLNVIATDASILVNANDLAVQKSGSTLATDGSGLKVSDAGITATQINTSVAGNGISGGGGTALAVDFVNEDPAGTKNGVNVTFTVTTAPIASSELLFLNGVKLARTTHYSISTTTITMVDAPQVADVLNIWYLR